MSATIPTAAPVDPAEVMPTLLAAFVEDPGMRWLYPDEDVYERAFPEVIELAAGGGFDAGTVDVTEDGAAVAAWVPPGIESDLDEANASWAAHFQAHIEPARLEDVYAWGDQMGRFHPHEPHWYLGAIGVAPGQQGRGLGTALLRAGLARADHDGLPAYLESANPRNRVLYERHGFEVIGQIQVADSPPVWPMLRTSAS